MSDIICITNRSLCPGDFLQQIEAVAKAAPAAIVLREKDLTQSEYTRLAKSVLAICQRTKVPCILHSFVEAAIQLDIPAIHLPLPLLRQLTPDQRAYFTTLGASCHSVPEAMEAEELGCTYITAGHVFATDCKKDLPPRGPLFLQDVCRSVSIPVYAIGGITADNIGQVRAAGAAGACVMSTLMQCPAPSDLLKGLEL